MFLIMFADFEIYTLVSYSQIFLTGFYCGLIQGKVNYLLENLPSDTPAIHIKVVNETSFNLTRYAILP